MSRVQAKPTPNWCPQVNPDEPWTGRCVKEKIAEDAKRHRCHKRKSMTNPCMRASAVWSGSSSRRTVST
jgi:hypothetical protein